MFCRPTLPLDSSLYDELGKCQELSYKLKSRTSNVTKPLFKNSEKFSKNNIQCQI
jgi:hypothetical protein